jgi:hypothetical protein
MYFIELIYKKFFAKKNDFIKQETLPEPEQERCEHVFMPIDSTGEILACRNCGAIVQKRNLKNIEN